MNIKGIIRGLVEFMAVGLGVLLLCVYEPEREQYGSLIGMFVLFVMLTVLATILHDYRSVASRVFAIYAVILVFFAEHKHKLNATELILLRRKNRIGNYYKFYIDTVDRYYEVNNV